MDRIAALIPAYNSGETVAATLESLQLQNGGIGRLTAVYVADDGSRDGTPLIAERAWRDTVPLRVLKNDLNVGERANVNRAVQLLEAVADWVLILHADDLVKPSWLEVMAERIDRCDAAVATICSSWDTLLPDGTMVFGEEQPTRPVERVAGETPCVRGTVLRGCWWHLSGCAIRLKALREVGEFQPNLPQLGDFEWLLRCLRTGWAVEYVPRALMVYRRGDTTVSATSLRSHRDVLESLEIVRQYVDVLTPTDIVRFHARRAGFLIRRMARAASRGRPVECAAAVPVLGRVGINLMACLGRQSVAHPQPS